MSDFSSFKLKISGEHIACSIYGHLQTPKKIILFCHGFPGTNRLQKLAPALNWQGEQVMLVELHYRGDKKSNGKFSFIQCMEDVKITAEHIQSKYPDARIYALGYSMGGFYCANIAKQHSGLFDKLVLLNPVVDIKRFFVDKPLMDKLFLSAKKILRLHEHELYVTERMTIASEYDLMDFAGEIRTETIILQSSEEEVLPLDATKKFYSILTCRKKYVEVPNAKHDLFGDEKEILNEIYG